MKLTHISILVVFLAISFAVSEAKKKHLTREELREKALQWFQPGHAAFNTVDEDFMEDGSGDGTSRIAASIVMVLLPVAAMLLK